MGFEITVGGVHKVSDTKNAVGSIVVILVFPFLKFFVEQLNIIDNLPLSSR